jgi:hypothetical protein
MAYLDIYNAATNATGTLRKQVTVAVAKAAVDVLNEAGSGHVWDRRQAWAKQVLLNPVPQAETMLWKVLENATIQASPDTATDSDAQFVVNSLVDLYAGN